MSETRATSSGTGYKSAGGELAFANLEHRVGFGYVDDQMGAIPGRLLVEAVGRCLDASGR